MQIGTILKGEGELCWKLPRMAMFAFHGFMGVATVVLGYFSLASRHDGIYYHIFITRRNCKPPFVKSGCLCEDRYDHVCHYQGFCSGFEEFVGFGKMHVVPVGNQAQSVKIIRAQPQHFYYVLLLAYGSTNTCSQSLESAAMQATAFWDQGLAMSQMKLDWCR